MALSQLKRLTATCRNAVTALQVDSAQVNALDARRVRVAAEWPVVRVRGRRRTFPGPISGCHEVVVAEHTIVVENSLEHPIMCAKPWTGLWRGYLGSPLRFNGQVIGTMCVMTHDVRSWSDDDIAIIEGLARQVATGLRQSA